MKRRIKTPLWFAITMLASVAVISALMVFVVVTTDPGTPAPAPAGEDVVKAA